MKAVQGNTLQSWEGFSAERYSNYVPTAVSAGDRKMYSSV